MHNHHASWIAKTRDNHYHSTTQLLNHTSPHDHPIVKPPYFAYAGSEFWHEKWPKPLCVCENCNRSSCRISCTCSKTEHNTTAAAHVHYVIKLHVCKVQRLTPSTALAKQLKPHHTGHESFHIRLQHHAHL